MAGIVTIIRILSTSRLDLVLYHGYIRHFQKTTIRLLQQITAEIKSLLGRGTY